MASSTEIKQAVLASFASSVDDAGEIDGVQVFYVNSNRIADLCSFLKETNGLQYDYLTSLCGVDYSDRIEVVYHLYSYELKHSLILKVKLNAKAPVIPSVCSVWKAGNWQEREAYDMFGIVFEGHPDLRRILLEPDWEGFPLRKDYKI